MMKTAIWWIRRDLRLADNQALQAALENGDCVIPTFILDPALLGSHHAESQRLAFLLAGLRALDADLRKRGSRLIIRHGQPLKALTALLAETAALRIFAEADHTPYARARDAGVAAALPLTLVGDATAHPPEAIYKADGTPYVVFTPFSRAWKALPAPSTLLPAPDHIPTPDPPAGVPLPTTPTLSPALPFPPAEAEAQRRLATFAETAIRRYADDRDRMDLAGTSQLSPYLRFGMISARQAVVAAQTAMAAARTPLARKSAETWLNELIWREFYASILYHFPHVLQKPFRPEYEHIAWRNNPDEFAAWREGRSGYPIVDAAMRQLAHSGWMHNRARMIAASFLVKDLLIDWRWGERWFMQQLVDGDPASNNGGWQWTAGTGTDVAPYFRIFNPITQSKKFDPEGAYIRRWLPELAAVPLKYLHEPWTMPEPVQRQSNSVIGRDYPQPLVDHGQARERTLSAYAAAKNNPPGRE